MCILDLDALDPNYCMTWCKQSIKSYSCMCSGFYRNDDLEHVPDHLQPRICNGRPHSICQDSQEG